MRKNIFDRIGYFNDRLKSSGDREWGMRVSSRGDRIIYADDTRVAHSARSNYRQLHQKIVRLAGGFHDLGKLTMKRGCRATTKSRPYSARNSISDRKAT
ncbi:MAG: hypothetical protein ACRC2R_06185 [Xenococcaceae cyanobacterium]